MNRPMVANVFFHNVKECLIRFAKDEAIGLWGTIKKVELADTTVKVRLCQQGEEVLNVILSIERISMERLAPRLGNTMSFFAVLRIYNA